MADQQLDTVRPSLARLSAARLGAQVVALLGGGLTGIATARTLGPAAKGNLATLLFFAHELVFYACALGLSDAVIILRGRRDGIAVGRTVAAALPVVGLAGVLGAGLVLGGAGLLFDDLGPVLSAVVLAAATLPLWLLLDLLLGALNAEEEFVLTGSILAVSAALVTAATIALVSWLRLGVVGGVAASAVGPAVAVAWAAVVAWRRGVRLRPRWDPQVLRRALRLGAGIQVSYLLIAMAQRVDQVLVFAIAGSEAAGHYSVALTVGLLVTHVPGALSMATFPRAASVDAEQFGALLGRVSRLALAGAVACGATVAAATPLLVPLLFGPGFVAAVVPTLVLVVSGILSGQQWVLSRAFAARGRSRLLVVTYLANLLVMGAADVVLIPALGAVGAAIGSTCGAAVGVALCAVLISRTSGAPRLRYCPRWPDFLELGREVRDLLASARRSTRRAAQTPTE